MASFIFYIAASMVLGGGVGHGIQHKNRKLVIFSGTVLILFWLAFFTN